jgi:hypothetical protein
LLQVRRRGGTLPPKNASGLNLTFSPGIPKLFSFRRKHR